MYSQDGTTPMSLPEAIKSYRSLSSPEVLVGYSVTGRTSTALVESGPSNVTQEYLRQACSNIPAKKIEWIVVSHIHIDHSGGAWRMVKELPNARVGVYERGARHLIDPSRLVISAREALGDVLEVWGPVEGVPQEKVASMKAGATVDLGGKTLRLIAAPGHAPHSSVWYLEEDRVLFSGDSLGIFLDREGNQLLWPTSPPPSYNHDLAMETISQLKSLKLDLICFPHFGYTSSIDKAFASIDETFSKWAQITRSAIENNESFKDTLDKVVQASGLNQVLKDDYRRKLVAMDLRGMLMYQESARAHSTRK